MDSMSITEAVKEWHEIADRDIASAKHLLNMIPAPYDIIAYHCQQCGEKYLKSYLVYNDQDVIKTHDLTALKNLCTEFDMSFSSLDEQCQVLTRYITTTRYPPRLNLTDSDIKKAIEFAEEIREFVLKVIDE
jgi:HEPN domain-containing protein